MTNPAPKPTFDLQNRVPISAIQGVPLPTELKIFHDLRHDG